MSPYIIRSIIRAFVTMFIVLTLVFIIIRVGPVDPVRYMLGNYATAESYQSIRAELKLDLPLHTQYAHFLNQLLRGDLGRSYINKQSVVSQLLSVLPYTLELLVAGILIGIFMGVPSGILAALKPNSIFDHIIRLITMVGVSIPTFVSGIFLIWIFSIKLNLLPIFSVGTDNLKSRILLLILPAFSVGIWMLASITRLTRASLLDVLQKDYITTARSKGISESLVILGHALMNSLLPLITYLGISVNILLGSAVLTEIVFTRPGVGILIVDSIKTGDFEMVQSLIMLYAAIIVIVNLFVDISYSLVDPRIVHK
ncbi:MAG: ABC transporter permease [Atribacterota bacterium]